MVTGEIGVGKVFLTTEPACPRETSQGNVPAEPVSSILFKRCLQQIPYITSHEHNKALLPLFKQRLLVTTKSTSFRLLRRVCFI